MSSGEVVVKPQVEVMPQLELPGVGEALANVENLTVKLAPLREQASTIKVEFPDREGYQQIGDVLSQVRSLRKEGEAVFGPFNVIVDRVKSYLRTKLQKHTNTCEEIESLIKPKMKAWEQAELKATEEEQEKINKEARKSGSSPVTVAPSVPSVAGYRRSTVYKAEVTDADRLLNAWVRAKGDRKKYLRQFIIIDLQKLNEEARRLKDPDAMAADIPGIRAWKE